jgi:hypothetical protein
VGVRRQVGICSRNRREFALGQSWDRLLMTNRLPGSRSTCMTRRGDALVRIDMRRAAPSETSAIE